MSATVFVISALLALSAAPLLGAALRSRLPRGRRPAHRLEPVVFGVSQKARRSPRHAVLLHRGLLSSFFMALVALALLPAATRLGEIGLPVIPVALAFALPSLLVTLHARRRGRDA